MPPRPRRYGRRTRARRTRYYRRKRMYKTSRKLYKYTVHNFRQTVEFPSVRVDSLGSNVCWAPVAGDLSQFGAFSGIYDQYKIKKITFRIEPPFTQNELFANLGSNTTTTNKFIRVVHDYDDTAPLTAESQYLEYANMKSYPSVTTKPIRITLYPKIAGLLNQIPAGNASYMASPKWVDCGNPQVPHMGIKAFFPGIAPAGTNTQVWRIFATFLVQFKNLR